MRLCAWRHGYILPSRCMHWPRVTAQRTYTHTHTYVAMYLHLYNCPSPGNCPYMPYIHVSAYYLHNPPYAFGFFLFGSEPIFVITFTSSEILLLPRCYYCYLYKHCVTIFCIRLAPPLCSSFPSPQRRFALRHKLYSTRLCA